MTDSDARKAALIDLLIDDFDGVDEPPDYAVTLWSENQIRAYFESGGSTEGLPEPGQVLPVASYALEGCSTQVPCGGAD
jgi:hypothetical protein